MSLIRSGLWIGSKDDATNESFLRENEISVILSAGCAPPAIPDIVFEFLCFPGVLDHPEQPFIAVLSICVDFLIQMHCNQSKNVLVHCIHGQSRSCAIVVAYLTSLSQRSHHDINRSNLEHVLSSTVEEVKSRRQDMCINPGFLSQLHLYVLSETALKFGEQSLLYTISERSLVLNNERRLKVAMQTTHPIALPTVESLQNQCDEAMTKHYDVKDSVLCCGSCHQPVLCAAAAVYCERGDGELVRSWTDPYWLNYRSNHLDRDQKLRKRLRVSDRDEACAAATATSASTGDGACHYVVGAAGWLRQGTGAGTSGECRRCRGRVPCACPHCHRVIGHEDVERRLIVCCGHMTVSRFVLTDVYVRSIKPPVEALEAASEATSKSVSDCASASNDDTHIRETHESIK